MSTPCKLLSQIKSGKDSFLKIVLIAGIKAEMITNYG